MLKSLTIHMKTEKDESNEGRTCGQSIGELGRGLLQGIESRVQESHLSSSPSSL